MNSTPDDDEFAEKLAEFVDFWHHYDRDKNCRCDNCRYDGDDNWWQNLVARGWDRYAFFRLIERAYEELPANYEGAFGQLYEIETGLRGHCSVNCIERFKGESENRQELVKFVRSLEWLPIERRNTQP